MGAPMIRQTTIYGMPALVGGVVSIEVRLRGLLTVRHVGIVSDRMGPDGQPMILHNSQLYKRVAETTATDFCRNQAGPMRFHGYPGALPPQAVIARARAQLGRPYRAIDHNCEHFVTGAHGMLPCSPQVADTAGKTAVVSGLAAVLVGAVLAHH